MHEPITILYAPRIRFTCVWELHPRAVAWQIISSIKDLRVSEHSQNGKNDKTPANVQAFSHSQLEQRYLALQNDEIDLRELFVALWKDKWIVVAFIVLFTTIAAIHALKSQEWWSSNAVITTPQRNDYSVISSTSNSVPTDFLHISRRWFCARE